MEIGILYGSKRGDGVEVTDSTGEAFCRVRMETVEAGDLSDALLKARPQDGEIVLNSMEVGTYPAIFEVSSSTRFKCYDLLEAGGETLKLSESAVRATALGLNSGAIGGDIIAHKGFLRRVFSVEFDRASRRYIIRLGPKIAPVPDAEPRKESLRAEAGPGCAQPDSMSNGQFITYNGFLHEVLSVEFEGDSEHYTICVGPRITDTGDAKAVADETPRVRGLLEALQKQRLCLEQIASKFPGLCDQDISGAKTEDLLQAIADNIDAMQAENGEFSTDSSTDAALFSAASRRLHDLYDRIALARRVLSGGEAGEE